MNCIKEKHPSGKIIKFYDYNHTYLVDDFKYPFISTTTLLKRFYNKFDMDKISKAYSKKHSLNVEDVKRDWKKEGEKSIILGNNCHFYSDSLLRHTELPKPYIKKESVYFKRIREGLKQLFKSGFKYLKSEYMIADLEWQIAGTIDLLLEKDNIIYIFDWKTNKIINMYNSFERLKHPLSHLEDCNFNQYSLQLNIYKQILIRNAYFTEYDVENSCMVLLHITNDLVVTYTVPDMLEEVKKMIEGEKKA